MKTDKDVIKVVCPRCGRALPIRIKELQGKLVYTLICPQCKQLTETTLNGNQ